MRLDPISTCKRFSKVCLPRLAHPSYRYGENAWSECLIMVNNPHSFVDKEVLYAILYFSKKMFSKIRFCITPNFLNLRLFNFQHEKLITMDTNLKLVTSTFM